MVGTPPPLNPGYAPAWGDLDEFIKCVTYEERNTVVTQVPDATRCLPRASVSSCAGQVVDPSSSVTVMKNVMDSFTCIKSTCR